MTQYKACPSCKQIFPLTSEYFHRNKSSSTGFSPRCKPCRLVDAKEYGQMLAERKPIVKSEFKTCTKCLQCFPSTSDYFHRHKRAIDGLSARCKSCRIEDNNEYKRLNPDKLKESNRKYNETHKEQRREQEKKKPSRQPEYIISWRRARYLRTAEEQKEASRNWRAENPEKRREKERRRRAAEKNVPHEFYTEQMIFDAWGTDCHYCDLPIDLEAPRQPGRPGWENGLHLDHVIPITKGGPDMIHNVKPAHGLCNLRKLNLR